jgi:hypothetical protein
MTTFHIPPEKNVFFQEQVFSEAGDENLKIEKPSGSMLRAGFPVWWPLF